MLVTYMKARPQDSGMTFGTRLISATRSERNDAASSNAMIASAVRVDRRPERDVVVLNDEDCRQVQDGGEVHSFVRRRTLRGAVTDPGEGDMLLAAPLDRQADAGEHRHQASHETVRRDDAALEQERQAGAEWRTMCKNAPDYLVIVDEDLRFIWINRVHPDLKQEDVIGHTVGDFSTPETVALASGDPFIASQT